MAELIDRIAEAKARCIKFKGDADYSDLHLSKKMGEKRSPIATILEQIKKSPSKPFLSISDRVVISWINSSDADCGVFNGSKNNVHWVDFLAKNQCNESFGQLIKNIDPFQYFKNSEKIGSLVSNRLEYDSRPTMFEVFYTESIKAGKPCPGLLDYVREAVSFESSSFHGMKRNSVEKEMMNLGRVSLGHELSGVSRYIEQGADLYEMGNLLTHSMYKRAEFKSEFGPGVDRKDVQVTPAGVAFLIGAKDLLIAMGQHQLDIDKPHLSIDGASYSLRDVIERYERAQFCDPGIEISMDALHSAAVAKAAIDDIFAKKSFTPK